MSNLIESYNKINNSFNRKLVFHLGSEAGFYSEFNNMIYAILYCLKNKYKFVLYSKDANFKINDGWTDFFLPFCKESHNNIHHIINKRVAAPRLNKKQKIKFKLYRILNPKTSLTYQIWPKFFCPDFEQEYFDIPELGISGSLKEASRIIVNMIYRPNNFLKSHIQKVRNSINLPEDYVGINIRRGDKNTEFDYVPTQIFIDELEKYSNCKNVFIFTDDYTIIRDIKSISNFSQNYNLYYLIDSSEQGYIHADFLKLSIPEKETKLLKMLTSMEIMSNANICFGSYTNNPGFFLGMRMDEGKFVSLQKKNWYQFEMSDVVGEMSDDMKKFLIRINAKL